MLLFINYPIVIVTELLTILLINILIGTRTMF